MKLIFTRKKSLVSWLIRKFTDSEASHVVVGGLSFYGQEVILHSTHGGLRVDVLEVWIERTNSVIIEEWEVLPDVSGALPILSAKLGSKYDLANLFGNALSILLQKVGIRVRNLLADPNRFVCSELVVHLDPGGFKIPDLKDLDPERASPEDLIRLCRRSPAFRKIQ